MDKEQKSNLSKVTPNPRKQQFIRQGQFALLVFVCLVILIWMFLPHQEKRIDAIDAKPLNTQDMTLSQNLELIERMKLEERNKLLASREPIVHRLHPPKLRINPQDTSDRLSKELQLRINAPVSFDIEGSAPVIDKNPDAQTNTPSKTLTGADANSQFVNTQNDITPVMAQKLPHPEYTIPAGEIIPATLETAINSDLPGMIRAITSRDVYSLIGGHLLIPRGATLVGQYSSGIVEGQSRILVVWSRVQLPDGIIVSLNSPGTDMLGRGGQGADHIERHFFERFGTSALLSVLGAYTATAGVNPDDQYNSASQYRMAIANSFQQTSGQTLEKSLTIPPTLQVNQGASINVFVAHDLDFEAVGLPQMAQRDTPRSPAWKQ